MLLLIIGEIEMKAWFNSILTLIKNNKLTALYIVIAIVVLLLVILTICVCVKKRNVYVPNYDDKSDFVHKVLTFDANVYYQLLTIATILLAITAVVLFCTKQVIAAIVVASVFALLWIFRIALNIKVKFNRVEYNNAEIYKFSFLNKTKIIRWEDIKTVEAKGYGSSRKIVISAKKETITIPLNMSGYYDFTVFAEKKLEGKNFEAIKIAKARR